MRLVSDNEGSVISKACHVWEVEGTNFHTSLSESVGFMVGCAQCNNNTCWFFVRKSMVTSSP